MLKNGMKFYDERNDRYITLDGVDCDPHVWSCEVLEMDYDDDGDVVEEHTSRQLFHEYELSRMREVA